MILYSSLTTFLLVLHLLPWTVWVCLWYQDRQRKQQGSAWRRRKRVMITLSEKDIWSRFCDATFYYKSTQSPWFTVTHWRAKQNNTGRNALTYMSMFRAQEYTEIFTYRVSVLTHSLQIIYPQVLIYGKSIKVNLWWQYHQLSFQIFTVIMIQRQKESISNGSYFFS